MSADLIPDAVRSFVRKQMSMTSDSDFAQVEKLNDGMSGAVVYRVKIKSKRARFSGSYIIKCVDTTGPWYQCDNNEKVRNETLRNRSQQFGDRLVDVICSEQVGNQLVIIYSQAVDSVAHAVPLEQLKNKNLIPFLFSISYELLSKFNSECTEETGGRDFFSDILTYRLTPDGNFTKRVRRLLKDSSCPAIVLYESVFPNPDYYMIHSAQQWQEKVESVIFRKGNMHGDLHGKNILCWQGESNDPIQYSVIDYDSYREDGYLLFDHAYLELYFYLFNKSTDNDCKQWMNEIAPLITTSLFSDVEEEPGVLIHPIRNAICKGITKWVEEAFPQDKDDIEKQFRMARIAAGINFFSKGGIDDDATLTKLLLYIGINLRMLFREINLEWKDSPTTPITVAQVRGVTVEMLWAKAVKRILNAGFVPILISDDMYEVNDYEHLQAIFRLPWTAVFDIGMKRPPNDMLNYSPNTIGKKDVRVIDLLNEVSPPEYTKGVCAWVTAKSDPASRVNGVVLWSKYGKKIRKLLERIQSAHSMQPIIYVFDISNKAIGVREHFLTAALEDAVKRTSLVFLRDCGLTEEYQVSLRDGNYDYAEAKGATLQELSDTVQIYWPEQQSSGSVVLPAIADIDPKPLTEKELARYGTSVELVYSGLEEKDAEEDFGESFYHGNEIRWYDLEHQYDLPVIRNYNQKLKKLQNSINESGHRIKELYLIHGAGTGGTTLAKRFLWDLRDEIPCMRLIAYTKDTAEILMDIYSKTRKRLLLAVETGSTVITNEQLVELKNSIRAKSGKLMILRIERSKGSDEYPMGTLVHLHDTLPQEIAVGFNSVFRTRASSTNRKENLRKLTYSMNQEWMRQRCAFFYGFYTYMEDYNMTNMIQSTVQECTDEEKRILSDMALLTIYSQNICIPHAELCARMHRELEDVNPMLVCQFLKPSISKLLVEHGPVKGLRICHPFVAKKLLEQIWNRSAYQESVFFAASQYIDQMYNLYGETDEVDLIYKELLIEREIVDSQRMKFSQLIEDIEHISDKKQLFQKLIQYYPYNAHYYNHLARLMVANREQRDYDGALNFIDKALEIAESNGDADVSMHYITKGSILAKRIHSCLDEEIEMVKQEVGVAGIQSAIERIEGDYALAYSAFSIAREKATELNSYSYFPCIHMEHAIIQDLRKCDNQKRGMEQLIEQHRAFSEWYTIHLNRMCNLFNEMKVACWESETEMLKKAQYYISLIQIEKKEYYIQKLKSLIKHEDKDKNAPWVRRAFSNMLYINNNFSWNGIRQEELDLT